MFCLEFSIPEYVLTGQGIASSFVAIAIPKDPNVFHEPAREICQGKCLSQLSSLFLM